LLGGDLAEPKLASHPGIGEDDVDGFALGLHRAGIAPELRSVQSNVETLTHSDPIRFRIRVKRGLAATP
jgi:hypothetical protein